MSTEKRAIKQRMTVAANRGRLTRAARRGYVTPVKIKGDPDRYLHSHARMKKAAV